MRSKGSGTIINRPKGSNRWSIIIELPDDTGKRNRRWHPFKGTKKDAQTECARLLTEIKEGRDLEPNKVTTGDFLDRWLIHIKTQVSPKTFERYGQITKNNLKPAIGGVKLRKLKPVHISQLYAQALESGRKDDKPGGLSARTVGHMHRVLKQALSQAVIWKELFHNPAEGVKPPQVEWKPMQVYDFAQTAEMISILRGKTIFIPALLAATCGLRRGEICALRWKNVDFDAGQLKIVESLEQTKSGLRFKSPKNGKGRTVALAQSVAAELRIHRASRAQDLLKLGTRLSDDDLVIAHADGTVVPPIYISQQWPRQVAKTKLARIRFHDLRHTHATQLLSRNVHPKVASERLGHSKIGITLDLYSHVIPGMQEDAAAMIDDALKAAAPVDKGEGCKMVAAPFGRTNGD
ncbi:site-specific integrase [Bradyrhizobium elkanii]